MSKNDYIDCSLDSIEQNLDILIEQITNAKKSNEYLNSNIVSKSHILSNIIKTISNKKRKQLNDIIIKNKKIKKKSCYICKEKKIIENVENDDNSCNLNEKFMCDKCDNINNLKRNICANLTGKIAIVTGGRVKIGWETAIKLLESNCTVIITTRFPIDALKRYSTHPEYTNFKDRLIIYPIDLRYKLDIDQFVSYLFDNFNSIDILIHNAAQTIRRPKEFFNHLIKDETNIKKLISDLDTDTNTNINTDLKPDLKSDTKLIKLDLMTGSNIIIPYDNVSNYIDKVFEPLIKSDKIFFPSEQYDKNHEQIDLRTENTWIQKLGSIDISECVELFSINTLAPFHLNQCLLPMLKKASGSYIVNVSSMEGVFGTNKTNYHPHTNMAKSALNMMTRTCADDLARDKIYMVSVDTGWVTNEFPHGFKSNSISHIDAVPLDNLDGACRVLDPVFEYFNTGKTVYGVFLKDYKISQW